MNDASQPVRRHEGGTKEAQVKGGGPLYESYFFNSYTSTKGLEVTLSQRREVLQPVSRFGKPEKKVGMKRMGKTKKERRDLLLDFWVTES